MDTFIPCHLGYPVVAWEMLPHCFLRTFGTLRTPRLCNLFGSFTIWRACQLQFLEGLETCTHRQVGGEVEQDLGLKCHQWSSETVSTAKGEAY